MNEQIRRNREVALGILKPSKSDLEHGLALHEQALVIESYGLGLSAPVDPEVFNAEIEAGASIQEIQALAEDMGKMRWAQDPELRAEYQETWRAAGVTCVFQNAGEESSVFTRLVGRLARNTWLVDAMPDFLRRATEPEDIVAAHQAGYRCVYLTTNGVPMVGDLAVPEEELRFIRVFAQLGVRMMHLTYNRRNLVADGCGEPGDAGLSDFGRLVIREMNRLGIIIDLAHTGWRSCLEAAAASERPVVVSHSAAYALQKHVRCKPDEVIRAVVDTGGTMGITNVPGFLGGSGDINAFLDHIDYVSGKFGAEAVSIGTDQGYASRRSAETERLIKVHPKRRARWESLWPPDNALQDPRWRKEHQRQCLAWTNWPLFTVGLVQRGYKDEDILGIVGGNILRVARAVREQSAFARPAVPGGVRPRKTAGRRPR